MDTPSFGSAYALHFLRRVAHSNPSNFFDMEIKLYFFGCQVSHTLQILNGPPDFFRWVSHSVTKGWVQYSYISPQTKQFGHPTLERDAIIHFVFSLNVVLGTRAHGNMFTVILFMSFMDGLDKSSDWIQCRHRSGHFTERF